MGEPRARGARILSLGDSYTIGEAVDTADRWPVRLAIRLREKGIAAADPVIIAKTGWTTDELDRAIDAAPPDAQFDLVTLLIGVNNQYRGRSSDEFRSQFRGLLDRAISYAGGQAPRVLVISIPDWGVTPFAAESGRDVVRIGREIDAFNAVCRDEASRAGARFVDVTAISRRARNRRELIAGDGLHPSGAMYEEWAAEVLPVALEALNEGRAVRSAGSVPPESVQ
jgi:lysophospholipase L1-like esterase